MMVALWVLVLLCWSNVCAVIVSSVDDDGAGDGVARVGDAVASKPSNPTRSIFSALKCVK